MACDDVAGARLRLMTEFLFTKFQVKFQLVSPVSLLRSDVTLRSFPVTASTRASATCVAASVEDELPLETLFTEFFFSVCFLSPAAAKCFSS